MATPRKNPEDKLKAGRPSLYTQDLAALICERVATNKHGLKKLCALYADIPEHSTINLWRFKYPEFSAQYLEAKRAQIDLSIEELDETMDENVSYYEDEKGNQRIDSPSVTLAIAKANNKKWFAAKLAPQLYGDTKKEEKDPSTSVLEKIISGELKIQGN